MSVIKADGYGHGAVKVAITLKASNSFAVARLEGEEELLGIGVLFADGRELRLGQRRHARHLHGKLTDVGAHVDDELLLLPISPLRTSKLPELTAHSTCTPEASTASGCKKNTPRSATPLQPWSGPRSVGASRRGASRVMRETPHWALRCAVWRLLQGRGLRVCVSELE